MNPDWRRLKAVVLESDDWGLCAWVPDERAHRALADTPAFRSPAGRLYGRSTLESAEDLRRMRAALLEFRGGDGFPPVWQANTTLAAPDFESLQPPGFEADTLPVRFFPEVPSRWHREGLWGAWSEAIDSGVWWPELHGLHHIPSQAWLAALRRGDHDALRALQQECLICAAVEAASEYDASEPADVRRSHFERATSRFRELFGRPPRSICPPDYRWDDALEESAERLGVTTIQGKAEQVGTMPRLRRWMFQQRWPRTQGNRFYMPARIAFEPRGRHAPGKLGATAAHRAARSAWSKGRPAVISTHRANYAHLDTAWSDAGRSALRELLGLLQEDGAVFLTDDEVRSVAERGWSARPIGARGLLIRCYRDLDGPIRIPVPAGATRVALMEGSGDASRTWSVESGELTGRPSVGEHLLRWDGGT